LVTGRVNGVKKGGEKEQGRRGTAGSGGVKLTQT